jgi:Flp pilus assembly protein TadD
LAHLGDPSSFLPALITLGLAAYAVAGMRGRNPIAYGILFFAITFSIVSNLLFSIGTTMAERFLYIPSLGLAIAAVLGVEALSGRLVGRNGARVAAGFLILICAAYSVKTISRNPAWKDNYTLFTTDIKVSPNSAKIQAAVASILEEEANKKKDPALHQALIEQAIRHFRRAIQIYPEHSLAWFGLGNILAAQGNENAKEAIQCYRHVVALEPDKAVAFRNIALTADKIGDFETALEGIRSYRRLRPADIEAGLLEASYLHKSGRVGEAIRVREEVARANPRNAQLWSDMGLFFANTAHDYGKAVEYLDRAIQLDSTKVGYYENLGYAQILNKQPRAAVQTLEKGVARFGDTHLLQWNLGVAWDKLGDWKKSDRALARAKELSGPR